MTENMPYSTPCGRGRVESTTRSGYHAFVDGAALRRPKGRAPVRFATKSAAKAAVSEFLISGTFTPPAFPERTYKTYDPEVEGYGNADQWRSVFAGLFAPMTGNEPFQVLGLSSGATWAEIKSAYRKLASSTHPDHGGSAETFCRVREAFEVLKNRRNTL